MTTGSMAVRASRLDPRARLVAVHDGHEHVEQDDVDVALAERDERRRPRRLGAHEEAVGLEDGVHELAVLLEVVDDEHPHAGERRDHDVLDGGGHGTRPSSARQVAAHLRGELADADRLLEVAGEARRAGRGPGPAASRRRSARRPGCAAVALVAAQQLERGEAVDARAAGGP